MEVKRIREVLGRPFTIKDLCEGYQKDSDDGSTTDKVFGFNGKLNIRPAFQRNNVYNEKQRNAVIQTILNQCPLNTMYWVDKEDGTYECLDGQQRSLAICKYVAGEFSVESKVFPVDLAQDFPNLQTNFHNIADQILDYELDIYICKGTPAEKMLWFHTINTAGKPLNEQELRNASFTGKWLTDAKLRFSTANGRGVKLATENPSTNKSEVLLSGDWNRQEYLETAIYWAGLLEDKKPTKEATIESYMLKHKGENDASELWQQFSKIIEWVRSKFTSYSSALKGLEWGDIYRAYQNNELKDNIISKSSDEIHEEIRKLLEDEEITAGAKGIYQYIIYGNGKYLQLRDFDDKTKLAKYEEQHHQCPYCLKEGNKQEYSIKQMHADHIMPWSKGGKTTPDNCQLLCAAHNESKSDKW